MTDTGGRRVPALGRWLSWVSARGAHLGTVVDQVLFSGLTFCISIALLPVTDSAAYGLFQLVLQAQIGQWYLGRAVSSEPLLVSRAIDDPGMRHGAAATSLAFGLAAGVLSLVLALFVDPLTRTLLLIHAVASPVAAVFDHSRYVLYAEGRPFRAVGVTSIWLFGYVAVVAGLLLTDGLTMYSGYLGWVAPAAVAAVVGALVAGDPWGLSRIPAWLRAQRRLIPGFTVDAAYLAFGISATFALSTVILGLAGFGTLRKALLPVTALIVLFIGVGNALLAHLTAGGPDDDPRRFVRGPLLASGFAALITVPCAAAVLLAPPELMTAAMREPWEQLRPLILILLGYALLLTTGQLALVSAKAAGRAWVGPRVRTAQLIAELALVALLGGFHGVRGVAVGMTLAWLFAAALAWHGLLRNTNRQSGAPA